MRIERIELRRFGHFVDRVVELDHPSGGLRFVVGPNEAGKSTLRAALRVGLFGFDGRRAAGRAAADSAVALHMQDDDVDRLVLVRQGMGAARDASGQPLGESLARWVPLGPEAFDRLYCLGHDELRRFGPELLQSGQDLGRIVFGAALGGTHVQAIAQDLARQLDALYAPGARTRRLNKAIEELTSLDTRLRSITVSADAWEALRKQIDGIEERLDRIRGRSRELTQETKRLERIRRTANARSVLREHREARERLLAEGPTPDGVAAARIASLLEEQATTSTRIEELRFSVARLEERLGEIGTDRSALDRSSEITALHQELGGYREAVERARRHGLAAETSRPLQDAERMMSVLDDYPGLRAQVEALSDLDAEHAGRRAQLEAGKARLGLGGVRDEDIAVLDVPTESEIEAARATAAGHAAARAQHREGLERLRVEIAETEKKLEELTGAGAPLPTAAEIDAARSERDGAWGVLRAWFVSDEAPADGRRDRPALAEQVHGGIERADTLVDRVRADTARAAESQALERQLASLRERQQQHETELASAEEGERASGEAWRALWSGVDARIGTPSEMSTWRHGWRELCHDIAASSASIAQADERRRAIEAAATRLRDALEAGGHVAPPDAGVLSLLHTAETLVEAEEQRRSDVQAAATARAQIAQLEKDLANLLPLLAPDDRSPPDRAITKLSELRNQQSNDREARSAIEERIGEATESLERAREAHGRLEASAHHEALSLGLDVDRLPEAVERAEAVADLQRQIDARTEQLLDAGDGRGLDALHAEAEEAGDLDVIAARLSEIVAEQEDLDHDRTETTRRLVELETEFDAIAGGDEVAATHEEQARALSRIEDLLDEIAVLTLAVSLLDRVLEAARTTGRGPLIDRAGHYFSLLTDSAFGRIDLETHGDRTFPVAVRADASRLYPDALSDGTLDQLWLAWRLAGVEHHIDQMGPIPLIVDDVLVNFDDARAGGAFRALASLATRTQVVVLTHHPHLVGVARERLGRDHVVIAELDGRPSGTLMVTQVVSAEEAMGRSPVPAPTAPVRPTVRAQPAPTGAPDASVELLRAAIDHDWRGKAELVERSGIAETAWNAAIRSLLADESVEQRGAKRGAKYRRVGAGGG